MDERDTPEQTTPEEKGYIPASAAKRTAAWIGVAYVVLIVLLNTYFLATGRFLTGVAGLLFCPALVGFALLTWQRFRAGDRKVSLMGTILILLLCAAAFLFCLITGIQALLPQL